MPGIALTSIGTFAWSNDNACTRAAVVWGLLAPEFADSWGAAFKKQQTGLP